MISAVMSNTGYFIGIGIEGFIIIVCAVLLALMLTGLLFRWIEQGKVTRLVKCEARAALKEAKAVADEEAAAQAAAQAEADRARMEEEAKVKAEAEAAAAEAAAAAAAKKAEEDAKKQAEAEEQMKAEAAAKKKAEEEATAKAAEEAAAKAAEQVEKQTVKERIVEKVVIVEQQKAGETATAAQPAPAAQSAVVAQPEAVEEAAATEEEDTEDGDRGFVVVQDGIVFNDSKTITELYDELSPEQQSYFDELREEALTKPDAELAISKNFVTVKIGKRNLIKLLIKRGVTVAEFIVENDALKQLRLSNMNRRGKSAIKVKPTVVQVIDLDSLKVAVDMINLAYEELMLE